MSHSSLLTSQQEPFFMTHFNCSEPFRVHKKSWFRQNPFAWREMSLRHKAPSGHDAPRSSHAGEHHFSLEVGLAQEVWAPLISRSHPWSCHSPLWVDPLRAWQTALLTSPFCLLHPVAWRWWPWLDLWHQEPGHFQPRGLEWPVWAARFEKARIFENCRKSQILYTR